MKVQDPTLPYATVVSERRRSRAAEIGETFRLGLHGLECSDAPEPGDRSAVIGASAWALKAEQVGQTVEIIGLVGGLLADLGFQVCPIGADAGRTRRPSVVVWVCGDETEADEYEQLAAMGVPGLSIGSCVEGLDAWGFIDSEDVEDREAFTRLFVTGVALLEDGFAGQDVSNAEVAHVKPMSNAPRRRPSYQPGFGESSAG